MRANAARVLARLPELPAGAVERLADCAADADAGVRLNAALALRSAAATAGRARDALLRLLGDDNPRLRLLAAVSVLDADPARAEAAAVLAQALADPSRRVRLAALEWVAAHAERAAALADPLRERSASEADPELSELLSDTLARLEAAGASVGRNAAGENAERPATSARTASGDEREAADVGRS